LTARIWAKKIPAATLMSDHGNGIRPQTFVDTTTQARVATILLMV